MRFRSACVSGLLSGSVTARATTSASDRVSNSCQRMPPADFDLVRFATDGRRRALEVLTEVAVLLTPCRLSGRDDANAAIAFGVGYGHKPTIHLPCDDEAILSIAPAIIDLVD